MWFSYALRDLMVRQGLLLRDIVDRSGIPPATVGRHSIGKSFPKVEDRVRYAGALEIAPAALESAWKKFRDDEKDGIICLPIELQDRIKRVAQSRNISPIEVVAAGVKSIERRRNPK